MPTFLIFRSGSVIETIQGADPRKLTSAIENAVKFAGAAKPVYSSVGRTLGGPPARGQSLARPLDIKGFMDTVIAFIGLYLYSLFSLDAYTAAENSPFNVSRVAPPQQPRGSTGRSGAATQVGKKLGTIADLSGGD
jgi:thioredoxin 1